jgi:hypothetical protein
MDFSIDVGRTKDQSVVFELSGEMGAGEPVLLLRESIKTKLHHGDAPTYEAVIRH